MGNQLKPHLEEDVYIPDLLIDLIPYLPISDAYRISCLSRSNNTLFYSISRLKLVRQDEIMPNGMYLNSDLVFRRINFDKFHSLKWLTIYHIGVICNLSKLTSLTYLSLYECKNITDISHLTNLKHLSLMGHTNIPDENINHLVQLETLELIHNHTITNISNLTNLTHLDIECGPSVGDISMLTKLKYINLTKNKNSIILPSNRNMRIIDDLPLLVCSPIGIKYTNY